MTKIKWKEYDPKKPPRSNKDGMCIIFFRKGFSINGIEMLEDRITAHDRGTQKPTHYAEVDFPERGE